MTFGAFKRRLLKNHPIKELSESLGISQPSASEDAYRTCDRKPMLRTAIFGPFFFFFVDRYDVDGTVLAIDLVAIACQKAGAVSRGRL